MKKKSYQKPLMVSEEFVPQEYVAAQLLFLGI